MDRDEVLLDRLREGTLSDAERSALEDRAGADPTLREQLRLEDALSQDLASLRELHAPVDLLDGLLDRIDALQALEDAPGTVPALSPLRALIRRLAAFRIELPAPAWALGTAAVLALGFGLGRTTAPPTPVDSPAGGGLRGEPAEPPVASAPASVAAASPVEPGLAACPSAAAEGAPILVRFVYSAGDASTVAIAGDFNSWEPAPMTHVEGADAWTATISLPAGTHEYTFVVDGQRFVPDPLAGRYRDDGFGNKNALIELAQATDL